MDAKSNFRRLGILASHPIQYHVPWFRALGQETDLSVYFAHRQTAAGQGKAGFGVEFDWDLDLLSGYDHTFLPNIARDPGVDRFLGCDTPEIRNIVSEKKFDAFIVTGWYLKSYWQAIRACKRSGTPVLVRGDSQLQTPRSRFVALGKQLLYRIGLRQFDGFLTVGERNREYLRHYGVPEFRMFSAPHFVDNERFGGQAAQLRPSRFELRRMWGISDNAFCVLFCGKFISKKRPMDLVKAATLLTDEKRLSNLHLLFVGSGAFGPEMRAHCNVLFDAEGPNSQLPTSSSQKPAASFAGFLNQTEISKAYVAADVIVLPSDGGETWGLVVNEAMASGTPAIVSDAAGCAPDLIVDGKTGFTFNLGDTEQLGERLAASLEMNHDGMRDALNDKMQQFSVEAAVKGTLQAIEALAGGRRE